MSPHTAQQLPFTAWVEPCPLICTHTYALYIQVYTFNQLSAASFYFYLLNYLNFYLRRLPFQNSNNNKCTTTKAKPLLLPGAGPTAVATETERKNRQREWVCTKSASKRAAAEQVSGHANTILSLFELTHSVQRSIWRSLSLICCDCFCFCHFSSTTFSHTFRFAAAAVGLCVLRFFRSLAAQGILSL